MEEKTANIKEDCSENKADPNNQKVIKVMSCLSITGETSGITGKETCHEQSSHLIMPVLCFMTK